MLSEKHHLRKENRVNNGIVDRTKPSLQTIPLQQQHSAHRIHHMIREMDRLSGFIRRYENKLEMICKSLLTSASASASASVVVVVDREENEVSAAAAAKELSVPEMFDFIIEQDWYKAHSSGTRSTGLPRLMFSKANTT